MENWTWRKSVLNREIRTSKVSRYELLKISNFYDFVVCMLLGGLLVSFVAGKFSTSCWSGSKITEVVHMVPCCLHISSSYRTGKCFLELKKFKIIKTYKGSNRTFPSYQWLAKSQKKRQKLCYKESIHCTKKWWENQFQMRNSPPKKLKCTLTRSPV